MSRRTLVLWIIALAAFGGLIAAVFLLSRKAQPVALRGVVIKADADPHKQLPIADVEVFASTGQAVATTKSDASGEFLVTLPYRPKPEQPITLSFRHSDYRPLVLNEVGADKLLVARLSPVHPESASEEGHTATVVSNVSLRYTTASATDTNIGSAVKTFEVVNTGNLPCNGQHPCSPDGRWKAAVASASLDAGEGNEFHNARVSCIAGPCPFTRIDTNNFSREGRTLDVIVRNWSDTTVFLLEAEVFRHMVNNIVRTSYPVTFGRVLNFTVPADAEGPSILAEIGGSSIVFPLGPKLLLSWANCAVHEEQSDVKVYRCELKSGYHF